MADRDLSLFDKQITSILDVPLSPNIRSLNLHLNRIPRIEGLTSAWHLLHLDLSSNNISCIEGLSSLTSLKTLSLSCNLITKVEGLTGLVNLTRLNLSYNHINNLTGLLYLCGAEYKLKHLSLHSNCLDSINHLVQCMLGVQSLREITLSLDGKDNPVCNLPAYRELVMQCLPQISVLDGLDRRGNGATLDESLEDIPGLEEYIGFMFSSDTRTSELAKKHGAFPTTQVDKALTHFRQRTILDEAQGLATPASLSSSSSSPKVKIRRPKRDIDHTSESDSNSTKENRRRSRIPVRRSGSMSGRRTGKENEGWKSDSDQENHKQKGSKFPAALRRKTHASKCVKPAGSSQRGPLKTPQTSVNRTTKPAVEEETLRRLVEEREQERGRRWEAEQTVKRLTEHLKKHQMRTSEEREPENLVLHTTDSDPENHLQKGSTFSVVPSRKTNASQCVEPAGPAQRGSFKTPRTTKPAVEEETFRTIVEERDQERERRWEAEQAVKRLTEQIKNLQVTACEEKDLQNLALHTTDRLKELLLKERSECSKLQTRVEDLEGMCRSLGAELKEAHARQDQHRRALRSLEDGTSHAEALRARQQAEEMKRYQELDNRAAVLKREADIHRAAARQLKDKLQQLHELLVSREEEHRKQLESRLKPDGREFQEAVAREVASMEQRVTEGKKQYTALEDEFREALTIEATRFSQLKEVCDEQTVGLSELKAALAQSWQKGKESGSLVQELLAMVKQQKDQISKLVKAKKEAVRELKGRVCTLESEAEKDRRLSLQLELLKKDKSRLVSQLTAHESVIDGLRAERKMWGQELAQQGASLAQDRGHLEARIEVLGAELESQKKHREQSSDALRIKTKMVEDQADTIRKLKEERDQQIRQLRDEAAQAQKSLTQRLDEAAAPAAELRERVKQLTLRKEELKQQLEDKELELEELEEAYSSSKKKWKEKAEQLTRLETQMMHMKGKFDSQEQLLLERDQAAEAHRAAVKKLHSVDDAFRRQLESVQESHQAELRQLTNDKEKQLEAANQKVFRVEEEMRALLIEVDNNKRTMEDNFRIIRAMLP